MSSAVIPMRDQTKGFNGLVRYSEARVPTVRGEPRFVVFRERGPSGASEAPEHIAVVFGEPESSTQPVLVRAHSECLTSEVLGSVKCDCRVQLDAALDQMAELGTGVLLYLRQEGRGIGLGNKIRAYALQAEGADTIEANHRLGFDTDLRRYDVAAAMLKDLGIERVSLITNNPDKERGLTELGIDVVKRVSANVAADAHAQDYLETKRDKLGHSIKLIHPTDEA